MLLIEELILVGSCGLRCVFCKRPQADKKKTINKITLGAVLERKIASKTAPLYLKNILGNYSESLEN